MLDVFFTVDVEIWCNGWNNINTPFSDIFRKYIVGAGPKGNYGLEYQLKALKEHALTGAFFVEPLFSTCYGCQPLEEIVGQIQEKRQEVQLHLHTEWVDESSKPLIHNVAKKRQHLFLFNLEEQKQLISNGLKLLHKAGAATINAFRAGSFGFNRDTLRALNGTNIRFDSSYNATMFGPASGVMPNTTAVEPFECEGIVEYPMSVFKDGTGALRHAQLSACSSTEMENLLWQALENDRNAFVILSHNFELLNTSKTRPDHVMLKRFNKLCSFLDRNRDSFRTCGFKGLTPKTVIKQPPPLTMAFWPTANRVVEQIGRRVFL